MNRQTFGVALLATSLIDSALFFTSWFHPMSLRMRAHGGLERIIVIVLSSLSLKAVLLISGALLAFWPSRKQA